MTDTQTSKDEPTNQAESHEKKQLGSILVVDDERSARTALAALLSEDGHEVEQVRDGYKALGMIEKKSFDIVLTDLRMPLMTGIELIEKAKVLLPDATFIVMTAYGSIEDAVAAMKTGAEEFLIKPLNFEAVQLVVERTLRRQQLTRELSELKSNAAQVKTKKKKPITLIGNSGPMKHVLQLAKQVGDSRATILIHGEAGTGKQTLAKFIHDNSNRASGPFNVVHCAALPEEVLEAELFGKIYRNAQDQEDEKIGLLEETNGGTIFLDEISALSPNIQVKLFQFLQTREFQPIHGTTSKKVDVRVICSSKKQLEQSVREGTFREDLYYRVNVVKIDMPPLSSRRSDIPQLVKRFVHIYAEENKKEITSITPEFLEILENHDWPGNVQELENIIERAVVLCDQDSLDVKHLPKNLGELASGTHVLGRGVIIPGSKLSDIERFAIIQTYEATGGKTAETAEILDVSQRKVQYKLREYMVDLQR